MEQGSTSNGNGCGNHTLQPKHKVFLSHSGAQKGFVEQLCVDLERCDRLPFFDKRRDCLPIRKEFPSLIFEAIEQCEVGVVVLSEEFFTSKWPMLELVAMANVKKRKPSFTIMPIFLGITFCQCRDVDNCQRWLSLWHVWAQCDSRIDVKDWENALQLFGPTNGLKYNFELGEVKFREEIVEAICKLVPPRTRFEDSHVQGRSRLCKVIYERIQKSKVSSYKVRIVGIYGVGGIGKTTICKVMCNELSEEFRDKVCHVELGSRSEEEVFKEVLGKLTNKNLEHLGAMSVDQYRDHLMRDMMNVKVFLTIDNVSSATSKQALILLQANYGPGSVLLVTARSLIDLTSLQIDASECIEMPELELEEARSIFLNHVACVPPSYSSNKDDLDLIASCIERCHFKKGDGISYHYHPLALQVLGEQLRYLGYVPARWHSLLREIDPLNPFGEPQHPVFSILRKSFDALNHQDQLLFMDVALFAPYSHEDIELNEWNIFEWFGMVYGIPLNSVMERLENLKRKSILENLGDGLGGIGMHDLWRETKVGKFEERRWIFEWDEYNALGEASVSWGGGLFNLRRMFFLDKGFMKLKDVDFACFPNVTVLKLCTDFASILDVDLRALKHLKSLELEFGSSWSSSKPLIPVVGLGSLSQLVFLRWLNIPSNSCCIDGISCLTNLRVLDLCGCGRVQNLRNLILLEVVCFRENDSMATILGLSSKHTNLQFLDLWGCRALQSCPGVGELLALQVLRLRWCFKLKEVPNLQKLKQLRKLNVGWCKLLRALPGLGDLVSLVNLNVSGCSSLVELPDMHNLVNLRILDLQYCHLIKSLPGLDELVCLQVLETRGCTNLTQLPNIYKLTNLQTLRLDSDTPLQSFTGWSNLISLQWLAVGIHELHDGPDLRKLTGLERLDISGWQGWGFLSLAELVLLESVTVDNCKGVHVIPDFKSLSRLHDLRITRCEFEDWSNLCNLTSLEKLDITNCDKLEALPELRELARLEEVRVKDCALLRELHGILGLQNLKSLRVRRNPRLYENLWPDLHGLTGLYDLSVSDCADLQWLATCSQLRFLDCSGCPIQELPDLANFRELSHLDLQNCVNLMNLSCSVPCCPNFERLNINGCKRLQALPDFTNSRKMERLDVANSGVVLSAQLIQDMKAHWPSICLVTNKTSSWVQSQGSSHGIETSCWVQSQGSSHGIETSSRVQSQESSHGIETSSRVQSQGSSHGIWRHIVGMITSLHCGCTRVVTHPT